MFHVTCFAHVSKILGHVLGRYGKNSIFSQVYFQDTDIFEYFVHQVLVVINYRGMGFDDLMVALQTVVAREGDKLTKQAVANVARYVFWFYYF